MTPKNIRRWNPSEALQSPPPLATIKVEERTVSDISIRRKRVNDMLTNLLCVIYTALNSFLLFGLRHLIVSHYALGAFEGTLLLFAAALILLLVTVPVSIIAGEKTADYLEHRR